MLDLSFPWPIGPVPIALTAWATYGLYRAILTRDGLTWVSAVSILGVVAFLAALNVHIAKPAFNLFFVIMLAQVLGTAACFLLAKLLWSIKKTKPVQLLRRQANRKLLSGIAGMAGFLLVMDGAFYLFPDAGKCEHFKDYMADKCAAQELFIGIHDLPLVIYFCVLLGVPALVALILFVWLMITTAGLPMADESNTEGGVGA
ncbi:hypothetical protein GGE16_003483 [Rhizobium leguminosarum]|uniref:Uncharacterized protein n=1 Tax=Rhizobium leguminosarum TaxID=384 RepID=A0AAE2MM58_RHILE|nr:MULTISPECIES: hypothetical protein [Rhizobium]MBB4291424.1 hypothetical protein [Rhizobium leguminosarum]MBB4296120.1 hypothetical protein [Rhizobium leguminosarum]MBB4308621.1 hypothetical protein [Rhizobium leguminosarum]MBB4416456.1 hypothetical protein [Rhizobium leguminosarum]MBB4430577.1 hypothetical protein [Rhizobium esperanzae]